MNDEHTPMEDHPRPSPDARLVFLEDLLAEQVTIAGDVVEIAEHTWAIHGSIAVDGDEILAEFETEAEARRILGQLPGPEGGDGYH